LPIGGGGPFIDAVDEGRGAIFTPVFRRFAIEGTNVGVVAEFCGKGLPPGDGAFGAALVGGLGAAMLGGFGAEIEDSGSEVYEEARFAVTY